MQKRLIISQFEWVILLTILFYLIFLPNVSLAETTTSANFSLQATPSPSPIKHTIPLARATQKTSNQTEQALVQKKAVQQTANHANKPLSKSIEGLIANYKLSENGQDSTGITGSMVLNNTQFTNNALYLNGLYDGGGLYDGYSASTPYLNLLDSNNNFNLTFSLKFFPIDFGLDNNTGFYRHNIITAGSLYRWLSIGKSNDNNSLVISFNNGDNSYTFENVQLKKEQWYTLSFSFSLQQNKFLVSLNGHLIGEKNLPFDFSLRFLESDQKELDSKLLFTNYSNGKVFYGNIKDLIIFNKFHNASELVLLNSDTSTTNTISYTDYFTLKIDKPLAVDASVDYQTRDGTAKAGTDYIATSGTATILAGQTSVDIGVDILIADSNKTFSLALSNPKGAEFPVGQAEIVVSHTIKDNSGGSSTVINAPTNSKIVEASSLDSDKITVSWMAAEDTNTAQTNLLYTVHVSETENFQPSASTQNTQVTGQLSAIATGLKADTQYYVRVVAKNQQNKESWSDVIAVKTVATAIKRTAQTVAVQNTQNPIISDNSVTFEDQGNTPQVGDVISNAAEDSYLRTVKTVSTQNGQTTVETEPATLTEVFEDIDIATTVKMRPVEPQTRQLARKQRSAMQMKTVGSQQHINWKQSGLTLISEVATPAQQKASSKPLGKTAVINDKQIKTGSHGQLQAPAFLSVAPDTTLYFDLEAKTTQSNNNWEICKISLIDIEHDDSKLEALATPQIGTTVISDVEQKGTLNAIWTPSTQHIDSKGRPYHFIFTAFIDDKGENCNGDQATALWDETITVDIPIYVSFGKKDSQADIQNKKLNFTGDFSIEDTVTFEFIPELNIAASIKNSTLQDAKIIASTDITVSNELTIKASGAGNLNDTQVLISPRKFIKVFMTPAGIPVVVGGEFSLNAKINANVTGAMQLTKRLELAFPNTQFGMEYKASRLNQWQAVKNFEPTYKFELSGNADASANVTVTLIPDFQIHFYDAAAGRMLVEPYAYAEADLHGQFRYLDDAGAQSYDLDYWFNTLEAGAGVNLKLYAGLEIFGVNIISYPLNGKRDDPSTFAQFTPIAKTPLWALPTLSATMDTTQSLPSDSRSILITGTAENIPFPFGNKKTLNAFTNWVTPKVLFADSETQVPTTTASLVDNSSEQAGTYWLRYSKVGRYLARLGGYSAGGSWLRQKTDIEILLEDRNNNGMVDLWETRYGISDPNADPDSDGLSNLEEFQQGLFPKKADNPIAAPQNLNASASDEQVTLTWDSVNNADSYTVYQAQEAALTPDSYALYQGGTMLANQSSPLRLNGLSNGTRYYFIVTANQGSQESPASSTVSAQPQTTVVSTGKLNDTGITHCANGSSNDLDCPVAGFPNQDAENGTNRMSFTKLDGGKCVKDNHTGLIWEVKQDKNGSVGDSLHDADDTYNWYNPDNTSNGGNAGYQDDDGNICYGYQSNNSNSYCNTHAYIQRVNAQGWCGYSDWRLPSRQELRSIVNYGTYNPAIDVTYFPNSQSEWFWSSSSVANYSDRVWSIYFNYGHDYWVNKSSRFDVRLVRSGQ